MPIWRKTFKNQESFETESLYIESGTQGHQVCSNDDPRLTSDRFTSRSNLCRYTFVWEKCCQIIFSKCIEDLCLKLTMCDQSREGYFFTIKMLSLWVTCPCTWSKIHGFRLGNLLLQNQESFEAESWYMYTASGTRGL